MVENDGDGAGAGLVVGAIRSEPALSETTVRPRGNAGSGSTTSPTTASTGPRARRPGPPRRPRPCRRRTRRRGSPRRSPPGRRPRSRSSRPSSSATRSKPGTSSAPDRGQPPARPPAAPRPVEGRARRRRGLEYTWASRSRRRREQLHLGRRGPLLRREHRGGVDEAGAHVARHHQLDAAQPLRRGAGPAAHPARRRWWPSRPRPTRTRRAPSSTAGGDQLAGAGGGGGDGSLPSAPPDQRRAPRPGPSRSPPTPAGQPPRRLHRARRAARSPCVGAVGPTERVEGALAAVGHRHLVAVPRRRASAAAATAAATSAAVAGARNLSGATTTRIGAMSGARPALPWARPVSTDCADRPVVLVSNRGPVSFRRRRRRRAGRPPGGRRSGVGPRPAGGRHRRHLDGGRHDRRRPRGRRRGRGRGRGLPGAAARHRPRDLPPGLRRRLQRRPCGSLHHGLFDLPRRPALRPPLARGVGGLPAR